MSVCETLPMTPDVTLTDTPTLSEPIEVGPFTSGIVFVKVQDEPETTPSIKAEIGVSPSGYDAWEPWWTPIREIEAETPGMHAARIENFGNWLRLRMYSESEPTDVIAWFVGQG